MPEEQPIYAPSPQSTANLVSVLRNVSLPDAVRKILALHTLEDYHARLASDRIAFLSFLKNLGLKVGECQRVANAVGRSLRASEAGSASAAAPSEDELHCLLLASNHEAAHALLKARGVTTLGERHHAITDILQRQTQAGRGVGAGRGDGSSGSGSSNAGGLNPHAAPSHEFTSAAQAIAAGQVAFVTLTNSGYLPYTANCLQSLELVNELVPLTVYCADTASYTQLAAAGVRRLVRLDEEGLGEFLEWKQRGWPRLMWLKCEVMRRALTTHKFVVFTDGDIVYERAGAVEHCVERLLAGDGAGGAGAPELLMQCDGLRDGGGDGWGLCAGFMAARVTPAVVDAFTVDEGSLSPSWDDQRHLNALLQRGALVHRALPLDLFPNGQFWMRHKGRLRALPRAHSPFLVHFNWMISHEKRENMRGDGKWYVGTQWDDTPATTHIWDVGAQWDDTPETSCRQARGGRPGDAVQPQHHSHGVEQALSVSL